MGNGVEYARVSTIGQDLDSQSDAVKGESSDVIAAPLQVGASSVKRSLRGVGVIVDHVGPDA